MRPLLITLELLVAAVVGGVSAIWTTSNSTSFLVGLVTFFLLEQLNVLFVTARIERLLQQNSALLQEIIGGGPISELRLLFGFKPYARLISNGVELQQTDYLSHFWHACMSQTQTSWLAVSYTSLQESWRTAWAERSALALQEERIRNGARIARVFVVDDEQEREALQPHADRLREIGANVRWILRRALVDERRLSAAFEQLGTSDFALVDGRWCLLLDLDRNRRPRAARALEDGGSTLVARQLFDEIFEKAHTFDHAPVPTTEVK